MTKSAESFDPCMVNLATSSDVGQISAGDSDSKKRKTPEETADDRARSLKFMDILVGTVDNPGILRKVRKSGTEHIPIEHQRRATKWILPRERTRSLLVHDPGLGKTYTLLLIVSAMYVVYRGPKSELTFLMSVPASCIEQWYIEATETLCIPPKKILRTNRMCQLTHESIANHTLIIVSRDTIGRAFSGCYEWVQAHHVNSQNRWVSQWDRIPNTPLHPLLDTNFAVFGIDELHYMRNPSTAWTKGHEIIASKATKTVGLTATPVFNSPRDLCGICTAMDIGDNMKRLDEWFVNKEKTRVNTATIKRLLRDYVHRADDSILNLPPITHEYVNFNVCVHPDIVPEYNESLLRARRIKFTMEHNGRVSRDDMKRLMGLLQKNQQRLVSPILAEVGASEFKTDPVLMERASSEETGSLKALRDNILVLKSRGFSRVMVAACHTSLLKIADAYLIKNCPECGDIITYDGSLSQTKRNKATSSFLAGKNTVLLMSIDAGGTGLHLVPGANAVIFWGSRPFSPMQIVQTSKRVHRIGQEFPVVVLHLIANGSVDHAINVVHGDKLTLSNAVLDMDMDSIEAEGGKWRTAGRIVDGCKFLSEDGIFPDEDITEDQVLLWAHERQQQRELQEPEVVQPCFSSAIANAINADPDPPLLQATVAQALLNLSTEALDAVGRQM